MNEKLVVVFKERQPKNHSIRWNAEDKDSALSSIYVRKGNGAFDTAKALRLTVEVIES